MALLEFMFASPAHFFGLLLIFIIIAFTIDSVFMSISNAFRRGKP